MLSVFAQLANSWESTPVHMARLDLRSMLQDAAIEEVCTVHCTITLIYLRYVGGDLSFSVS